MGGRPLHTGFSMCFTIMPAFCICNRTIPPLAFMTIIFVNKKKKRKMHQEKGEKKNKV